MPFVGGFGTLRCKIVRKSTYKAFRNINGWLMVLINEAMRDLASEAHAGPDA
jgi:hypothetical protein